MKVNLGFFKCAGAALVMIGIGVSVAALLGVIAYTSISKKG